MIFPNYLIPGYAMKAQTYRLLNVVLTITLILSSGCYSTRKVSRFADLKDAEYGKESVRALTSNSALYTFNSFTFTDSTITGNGSVKIKGETKDFEGTLRFSDILFLERYKLNYWQTLWIVPMTIAVGFGVSALLEPSKLELTRPVEGSCPFIYSYNGSEYRLEAEAFSTSVSKALEAETFHVLPSLKPAKNELKVRLSDERPETHVVNSVHLFAVDAGNAASVVLDTKNLAWPVFHPLAPTSAFDRSGKNILDRVAATDGKYWRTDLQDATTVKGFRDTVIVTFDIPQDSSEGLLLIDALNSDLVSEVYRSASAVLGDQTLLFYHQLEQDPELQELVREGVRKTSLRIEVKKRSGWVEVGTLQPQADVVPFTRAVHLEHLDQIEYPLTLRFTSMMDVWHIDALSVDISSGKPLLKQPLKLASAINSRDSTVQQAVGNTDSVYTILLPPDHIDVTFDSSPSDTMLHPVYVFSAQGYLYEWLPPAKTLSPSIIPGWVDATDRIAMLKYLIRHQDLFLPQIYAMWRENGRQ